MKKPVIRSTRLQTERPRRSRRGLSKSTDALRSKVEIYRSASVKFTSLSSSSSSESDFPFVVEGWRPYFRSIL